MGLFTEKYRKFTRYFYGTGASKIPLVKKVHSSILQSTVPEFITIYGYKMFLDQSDDTTSYSVMLDFETNEKKILSKYISEGDVVVDVGACLGYYTLFFRSLVGKTGKVIAFEPDPRYFTLLQKTINANKFENVVGQDHVIQTLANAISKNQIAHAYLFCGPRGVGKTTCARIFAELVNGDNDPDNAYNIFELEGEN